MISNKNRQIKFSKDSQGWLVAALDPYHDNQLEVEGLPDERSAPSVVQVHNQSYTLTVPTVAAGSNWDASVLFTGINTPINPSISGGMITVAGSAIHPYSSAARSVGCSFGALNIYAGASGAVMSTGAPVVVNTTNVSLGSVLPTDRCRLIGAAFEIHNTTAEVYKQGSLTVAQLPDCASDATAALYHDITLTDQDKEIQVDRALKQACTLPFLQAVPGSQTWPAADGVYAIPRMTIVPREIVSYAYTPGVAENQGANGRVCVLYGTDGKIATPEPTGSHQDATAGYQVPLTKPMAPNGFSPVQVFLTGLSAQSTLTITFRTIVEYFPALDSPLLPLASPSPCFDALVLGAYSEIVSVSPYAVPVDQNSAGEYFRKIMRIMGQALTLTSPMFGQYAPLVTILGSLGSQLGIEKKEAGPRADAVRKRR